jgi:hypothetical protein
MGPLAEKTLMSFIPPSANVKSYNNWVECYNGPITEQMKEKT